MSNLYKRLARAEAMADAQRAELMESLMAAYGRACARQDEADAAALARRIRDKLLAESDAQMALDRIGLDSTSVTKLIASLASVFTGKWARYRQALRDLPEQEGFPYNVEFPEMPEE